MRKQYKIIMDPTGDHSGNNMNELEMNVDE